MPRNIPNEVLKYLFNPYAYVLPLTKKGYLFYYMGRNI